MVGGLYLDLDTIKEIRVPISPTSMTGRRPIRSDNRPQSGAKINCMAENDENSNPIVKPTTDRQKLTGTWVSAR